MATELKTLNGQFHNQQTNEMENTKMSLTRFSGGKEGMKIQLTMRSQGEFFTHIALNKEEVKTLITQLLEI
tara:strand:+ start:592 stop:804 length:213 start_codon:yes stop_codon:yes gene_type:complete